MMFFVVIFPVVIVCFILSGGLLFYPSAIENFVGISRVNLLSVIFSALAIAGLIAGVWVLYWTPNRLRMVLSCIRICQVGAVIGFVAPYGILGVDKLYLDSALLGELTVEYSAGSSIVNLVISVYFMRKFANQYERIDREYNPVHG